MVVGAIACSESETGPITDDQGREVQLEGRPERIISHVPSITETFFALDLGDKVVGVSDYCNYPEEAKQKPRVGGYYTPSIEKIVSLSPDVVLTDGYPENISQLDGLNIPYIVMEPKDIDGILHNIELLGEITGSEDQASQLINDMEGRIHDVVATVADATRPSVFYVFDATDPARPWTAGPGSFVDGLIRLAGGENIAAQAQDSWIQFSIEELVDSDPDIILADSQMGTATISLDEIKELAGWQDTTAVREDRIYIIDSDLVNRHGPRIVQALEEIARIIHPEQFNDQL
jgi:iron complex transport system substrate-binding protein